MGDTRVSDSKFMHIRFSFINNLHIRQYNNAHTFRIFFAGAPLYPFFTREIYANTHLSQSTQYNNRPIVKKSNLNNFSLYLARAEKFSTEMKKRAQKLSIRLLFTYMRIYDAVARFCTSFFQRKLFNRAISPFDKSLC